jgi:hypothetical protein
MANPIFGVGLSLILLGALLFLATWVVVIRKPGFLLGTITMLWFKTLAQVMGTGLILLIIGAASQLLQTALFWRR